MLTPTQQATIKADILASPTLNAFAQNSDGADAIANIYNQLASPTYWVWRTRLTQAECVGDTSLDATNWSWTIYVGRSQGERDGWREMFADTGAINASKANVRQGLADIFSGAGGLAQRTHLLALGRRQATQLEKLLATGAGTTAAPSTMGYEGQVSYSDILTARESV